MLLDKCWSKGVPPTVPQLQVKIPLMHPMLIFQCVKGLDTIGKGLDMVRIYSLSGWFCRLYEGTLAIRVSNDCRALSVISGTGGRD